MLRMCELVASFVIVVKRSWASAYDDVFDSVFFPPVRATFCGRGT